MHKYMGVAMQYGVALHVSAVGFTYLQMKNPMALMSGPGGQFAMMLPFAAAAGLVAYNVNPKGAPKFDNWYSPPLWKKPEEPKKE